jgi:hypothetical protein
MMPLAIALLLAHGDASWIMAEPKYRDAAGIHCCGPSDCAAVPNVTVIRVRDGWRVVATGRVFRDDDPDLYISIDERTWLCNRQGVDRCLFVPGAGV